MRRVFVPLFCFLFAVAAIAQTPTAKEVYEKVTQSLPRPAGRPNEEAIKELKAKGQELANAALKDNAKILGEGAGLHYRGRLEMLAGAEPKTIIETFKACVAAAPDTSEGQDSLFIASQLLQQTDKAEAKKLFESIKPEKLSPALKSNYDGIKRSLGAEDARLALNGKPLPAFKIVKTMNAPADFDMAKLTGKVLVLDFWATWCPPCRAVVPDMVKLQAEHEKDGLQVIGVTKFYGRGMDFSAESTLPHGGKAVGGTGDKAMSEDDETKVNDHFIGAFKVNYPIVFSSKEAGSEVFHVTNIPTVFVVDRKGNVVGSVVGGGEENHKKLEAMIAKALAEKADGAAKPASGN